MSALASGTITGMPFDLPPVVVRIEKRYEWTSPASSNTQTGAGASQASIVIQGRSESSPQAKPVLQVERQAGDQTATKGQKD